MLQTLLILTGITLLIDAIGWKKFVYFISLGYGYSIAAIGIALIAMHWSVLTWYTAALAVIMVVYGCRLATYLLVRELKSKAYKQNVMNNVRTDYPVVALVSIWLSCVVLYVCQMFPITVRLQNAADGVIDSAVSAYIGMGITMLGLLLESLADKQKSDAKKVNPKRFVDTGLYRWVRCPNYFGEIVIWTGVFVSGLGCYHTWWHWTMALIGYIGIVYIMFSGARRLEIGQAQRYGSDPEFQTYIKKTPLLLPFVPIYSVARFKWLRG